MVVTTFAPESTVVRLSVMVTETSCRIATAGGVVPVGIVTEALVAGNEAIATAATPPAIVVATERSEGDRDCVAAVMCCLPRSWFLLSEFFWTEPTNSRVRLDSALPGASR
jgi:hypothetical protein